MTNTHFILVCRSFSNTGKQKNIKFISVSDFIQQMGQMCEHHGEELQNLVTNFRKRNSDLRKERYVMYNANCLIKVIIIR